MSHNNEEYIWYMWLELLCTQSIYVMDENVLMNIWWINEKNTH